MNEHKLIQVIDQMANALVWAGGAPCFNSHGGELHEKWVQKAEPAYIEGLKAIVDYKKEHGSLEKASLSP